MSASLVKSCGEVAAAWLIVQNTDDIKLTTFPCDRRKQQLRPVGSQISTTLLCTKLNGWSNRLDPVGPRLDRSATPASGQATRSPAVVTTADVHLESTVAI